MFNEKLNWGHRYNSYRVLTLVAIIVIVALPQTVKAGSAAELKELKPDTRESVRAVGQSLLRAKRSYVPDQASIALRGQIDEVRRLVNALAKPIATTPIEIQLAATSAQSNAQIPSALPQWQRTRTTQIDQLRSTAANMRSASRALRDKRRGAKPSLLQSIASFFGLSGNGNARGSIVTPVTDAALSRVEHLNTEIEAALALPANEQPRRMRTLSAALSPKKPQLSKADAGTPTPTFSTHTTHRRTW